MTINKTRRLSWVMCPPAKQLALILAFLLGALLVEKAAGIVPSQAEDFLDHQNVSSIAVLPPVGASIPDSVRKAAGDLFILKLTLRRSSVRVVRPETLVEQLNKAGKLSEFASFVNLLSQTGVVNRGSLTAIGNTAETDALLLINVLNYEEEKGSWWYGKGGKNFCRIQYSLFRVSDGERIWQSLEFRQHDSKLSTRPYPMERVVGDVSKKAVTSLLTGRENVDVRRKKSD